VLVSLAVALAKAEPVSP